MLPACMQGSHDAAEHTSCTAAAQPSPGEHGLSCAMSCCTTCVMGWMDSQPGRMRTRAIFAVLKVAPCWGRTSGEGVLRQPDGLGAHGGRAAAPLPARKRPRKLHGRRVRARRRRRNSPRPRARSPGPARYWACLGRAGLGLRTQGLAESRWRPHARDGGLPERGARSGGGVQHASKYCECMPFMPLHSSLPGNARAWTQNCG